MTYKCNWLLALGVIASLSLSASASSAADMAGQNRATAERFAAALAENYVNEARGAAMSAALRSRSASGAYDRLAAEDLADALQRDAKAVSQDAHLSLHYTPPQTPTPSPPDSRVMRRQNGLIPRAEVLDGNVGYLKIDGFMPLGVARGPMEAAFAFLASTDALIIDIRDHSGGSPQTGALLISFLSEGPPVPVDRFVPRRGPTITFSTTDLGPAAYGKTRPVFVLTSRATFSGGEAFAYAAQALKRATLVGERTAGGANSGQPFPLGAGFTAIVPSAQSVNPITGANWEGTGVAPDVPVPAVTALAQAHRLALGRLLAGTQTPAERMQLQAWLLKLSLKESKFPSIAPRKLVGRYAEEGPREPIRIVLRQGRLVMRWSGSPDAPLIRAGGDRYRPDGYPGSTVVDFIARDGKVTLLLQQLGTATQFVRAD